MDKKEIIQEIKKSKKYAGIAEEIIGKEVESFIKSNPRYQEFKDKFILKQIKEKLHKMYGSFQTYKKGKAKKLLEKLREEKDNKIVRELLTTNLSTKERLGNNGLIYSRIFEKVGKVNSILDLGCGLNPVAFPYMEIDKETRYYAYDINEEDLKTIEEFFDIYRINGRTGIIDLRDSQQIEKLPPADLCFMFKVLDPLEKNEKGHKLAEDIIKKLSKKCNFIVVSFATATLSGRKMSHPHRGWIERMLERLGMKFERFESKNEIFYIISSR